MDDLIKELEQLTQDIMLQIDEVSSDELELFVDKRQNIIDSMLRQDQREASVLQQARLKKIMDNDHAILMRMNSLKIEAKDWLIQRKQAKVQKNAYETSYAVDSIIVDTKRY
ncbi:hypothetical protein CXK86_07060 [Paenibacillus sp. BGI2013]|uniref:hypothetical protein n=1 Tax=Paenibacillus TaxID=44249 RepID=UPI00096FACB6|nr:MULTISPECIES: hypothetical protein [Paenibacillus]OMF39672.1 hypothetical protein BK136_26115 [Paenibacillus amylolyticus]PKQ92430.1 hypothetical protein CXK86_07060 [Paenibacillus sp. BGI2013]